MSKYNHVICDFKYKGDMGNVYTKIKNATIKTGLTVVGETIHYFNPQGISIIFILAESHLSIHTWEEEHKINIDVFSCDESTIYTEEAGEDMCNKSYKCVNEFLKEFEIIEKKIQIIQRE